MSKLSTPELNPLIDADYLVYRTGFAADSQALGEALGEQANKVDTDARKEILAGMDYEHWALGNAKGVLDKVLNIQFPLHTYFKLYLSGEGNFREAMATLKPYKGNRDPAWKPKYYSQIKNYLIDVWKAETVEGMEADDALGIEQFKNKDRSTVIVAIDKDLDLIPGHHYNWVKDKFYYINMQQGYYNFFVQMLEGDISDNVPGIVNIGPKTSAKILGPYADNPDGMRSLVVAEYKKQYGNDWLGAYNECCALLWILRRPDEPCPFILGE